MANFNEIFRHRHAILPVIHIDTPQQTIDNIGIAEEAGCDGVFLINMWGSGYDLLEANYMYARRAHPNYWIGINPLFKNPNVFSTVPKDVDGVWNDNAGVQEDQTDQPIAEAAANCKRVHTPNLLYFGGVAFKYQREVVNLAEAAKITARYVDVVTTSGDATGLPPTVEKIETIVEAVAGTPVAIASGLSRENIHLFRRAHAFLVGTSLYKAGEEVFDKNKVDGFVDTVRNLKG